MRILFFGTYDRRRHPRVGVLMEGCASRGDEVLECNVPLDDSTGERVAALQLMRPWRAAALGARVAMAWRALIRRARSLPAPDLVVVGYLAQVDVHLARRLWPRTPIVLDYLVSLADTAADRRSAGRLLRSMLASIDRAALRAADVILVDTEEHRELVPDEFRSRAAIVDVGAPQRWLHPPADAAPSGRLRVVFFGLFTPLQGTETIARAIALLAEAPIDFLMIGTGQDYETARRLAAPNPNVRWLDWVAAEELPSLVASHDVCLGIFGPSGKGLRVVPNKVFQGAAAGCAVVTADTPPQRRAVADAAILVPAGSPQALADALADLQRSPERVARARRSCYERAVQRFSPEAVIAPLYAVHTANRSRLASGAFAKR